MAEVSSLHREPLITEELGNSSEVDFTSGGDVRLREELIICT